MVFINALLAFGAIAFTVPLAIHLLFRNRFELLDWGAMHFLEALVRQNRRRMQLQNLLLLLIRCAIPILLAFCMARPVLTGWRALPGNDPLALVIALDTSDSLAARVDENQTRFDQLKQLAEQIINDASPGSQITILASGQTGQAQPFVLKKEVDAQTAISALRPLRTGGAPLSLEAIVSEGLRLLSASSLPARQLVLLTDNGASDFSEAQLNALESIDERRKAIAPAPEVIWMLPWKKNAAAPMNRRLTLLTPSSSTAVPGQKVTWSIEARDDTETPIDCDVTLRVDGQDIESKPMRFRNGVATVDFQTTIDRVGVHAVEAIMASDDHFLPDNQLRLNYAVRPPVDVWLVDGNPTNQALAADTDFLSIALSPFALSGGKSLDHFKVQKVAPDKLVKTSQNDENNPQIIVLADVGKLPDASTTWLQSFVVEQAGTLVLFAGPKTDDKVWDKQLLSADGKPMLPMQWGEVKSADEKQAGMKLDASGLTYPPLASFVRDARGTLKTVDLFQWRELTARPEAEANVVMRLDNGLPFLAIGQVGNGKIAQFATTANDRWTSLPRRLAYLPLMQQLFLHWSSSGTTIVTPTSGQPLVFPLIKAKAELAAGKEENKKQTPDTKNPPDNAAENTSTVAGGVVTDPNGIAHQVQVENDEVRFDTTMRAGLYRLDIQDEDPLFAVANVPDNELNRAELEASARETATQHLGATVYQDFAAYQTATAEHRFGRGIWTYLLLALLVALLLEPLIQQRSLRWQS